MTIWDWLISLVFLGLLIGLIFWTRKFVKDVSGFVVAGRKTRMWLGLSNNNAAGLGLASIAYGCQEGYRNGFSLAWLSIIGSSVALVLFGIFGFGIERLRASQAMTGGQFHEMRYARGLRLLVGSVSALGGIINQAAFPIVGAAFLRPFLGWPETVQILGVSVGTVPAIAAVMIALAVFFTILCGQVGIVLTDYVQGIIIMAGLFAMTWLIFRQVGTLQNAQHILQDRLGDRAFNPFLEGGYGLLWAGWMIFGVILAPFCSGPIMTKNASTDSPKVVRLMTLITTIFGQGKGLLKLTFGVAALIIVGQLQAPGGVSQSQFEQTITPEFLGSICPPILMGLLLSAFLFAAISTDDTYMLAWSSIIVNDVIAPLKKKPFSLKGHLLALRLTVLGIGLFLFFWGVFFIQGTSTTILGYLMISGTMGMGSAIAILAGLYWKRASTAGAYAAVLIAMIFPLADLVCRKAFGDSYPLLPQQTGIGTILASLTALVIFSLASRKPTKWVDYGKLVRESEQAGKKSKEAR